MLSRCFTVTAVLLTSAAAFAQPMAPAKTPAAPAPGQPIADTTNLGFANGIAAVVEDKIITFEEVRREVGPYIQQIQQRAKSQQDFDQQISQLEDSVIQDLIDRVLIVKEFYKKKDGDNERHIPDTYVDEEIARRQSEQFDNDRSKFIAYLRSKGQTMRDFRKEVVDDIVYQYMQQQQRKSLSVVSPVRIENYYTENKDHFFQEDKVHLRLIQLSRVDGATDAELKLKAEEILNRFRAGTKFEDLAKEFSQDGRKNKGGDWGVMEKSGIAETFRDPLFALKKGEVTQPILTPEGCFILFAEDRKYAGVQPIDEVRDQIEHILQTQMTRAAQERWLERLRRNGYVKHY